MDLDVLLSMAVSLDEGRPAVTDPDGRTMTVGALDASASRAASVFRHTGCTHVAFCDTNRRAFLVALFGAVKAHMPFVPLNYRLADEQLAHIVDVLDCVAVASPEQGARLGRLGVDNVFESSTLEDTAPDDPAKSDAAGDAVASAPPGAAIIDPDDVALLLYTSGTTTTPKAAILRHRHLGAYVIGTVEFGNAGPDEAALVSVPPYHIAGVMNVLSNLYLGRRIVYLDSFSAERWLATVKDQAVTHAMVVPTMLARIVSTLDGEPADTPSLRTVSYGGARMPVAVIEEALRLFPDVAFTNAYGLTETSSTVSVLGPEVHRQALEASDPAVRARLGSVGLPLPGIEIEVRDDGGRPCAPGIGGDICVRGEHVAGEYVGAGGAADGWFATRDRGYVDEDGYLFIEGRADDTIIRGGENISPAEIEDVLLRHPAVQECAVIGIDDAEWGQRIAAAVVLTPGSAATSDELRVFSREHLRTSKTPDRIVIVPELPYTDTGKLLRRVVRQELSGAVTSTQR